MGLNVECGMGKFEKATSKFGSSGNRKFYNHNFKRCSGAVYIQSGLIYPGSNPPAGRLLHQLAQKNKSRYSGLIRKKNYKI